MNPVAFADLLRSLTPAELDQLGAITREAYGPLADQLEAATRQVRTRMFDSGAADVAVADLPEPIVLQVLDQLDQWWHGRVSTCLHAPDPHRPQPVVAAAWKPGLIVCGGCTHLLRLPRKSAADLTCDLCGRKPAKARKPRAGRGSAAGFAGFAGFLGNNPGSPHTDRGVS